MWVGESYREKRSTVTRYHVLLSLFDVYPF